MTNAQRPVAANDNDAPLRASSFTTLAERRAFLDSLPDPPKARKARSKKPRLRKLAGPLRALLTWRVIASPQDFTDIPTIEGLDEGERPNLDCLTEVRPSENEIMTKLKGVVFRDVPEARLNGPRGTIRIAVGGDIERAKPEGQDGDKPPVVTRMGGVRFSNGAAETRCMVNKCGVIGMGRARIPLGGIIRAGNFEPRDRFRRPKGAPPAANDNATVRQSRTASPAAFSFEDPIAEREHLQWVRKAVGAEAARVLDLALVVANLEEIGMHLGFEGKTAERRGKRALLDACKILEEKLAA